MSCRLPSTTRSLFNTQLGAPSRVNQFPVRIKKNSANRVTHDDRRIMATRAKIVFVNNSYRVAKQWARWFRDPEGARTMPRRAWKRPMNLRLDAGTTHGVHTQQLILTLYIRVIDHLPQSAARTSQFVRASSHRQLRIWRLRQDDSQWPETSASHLLYTLHLSFSFLHSHCFCFWTFVWIFGSRFFRVTLFFVFILVFW